ALTPPSVSRASEASRSQPSSSSAAAVPQQPLVAQQPQAPLRLQLGIGSPGRGTLAPSMEQFGEMQMSAREAAEVMQTAFPAAYEWVLKRWLGPSAITEGAVYRRRLQQDLRQAELVLPPVSARR
ncbi:unnamed protein product, partial [Polarella glacialis]